MLSVQEAIDETSSSRTNVMIQCARVAVLVTLTVVVAVGAAAQTSRDASGATSSKPDWRERRNDFARAEMALQASNGADQAAAAVVKDAAMKFEQNPYSFTPIEAMDIIGAYYVPRDIDSKFPELLTMVAEQATLGWYDALRFTDESGREEIASNEGFFVRVFVVAGTDNRERVAEYLKRQPAEAAAAVSKGASAARYARNRVAYDVRWPSFFGLNTSICALSKGKECSLPNAMPQAQWEKAFNQSSDRVTTYYRD